jgi:(2Fe-2S) ferredoxin
MPTFRRHLFVCENERSADNPRGCCKAKGGVEVRAALKREVGRRGLKGLVRANSAGCLDQCEHGVTLVVYPEQVWYGAVTVADVNEIIERHVIAGEYVERLMLPDQAHLGGATRGRPLFGDGDAVPAGVDVAPKDPTADAKPK